MIGFIRHSTLLASATALNLACGGASETTADARVDPSHDATVGAPNDTSRSDGDMGSSSVGGTPVGIVPVPATTEDAPLPEAPASPPDPPPLASCLAEPDCPWSPRAAMPDHRRGQAAVAIDDRIYLFGGESAQDTRALAPGAVPEPAGPSLARFSAARAYHPTTDTWTEKAPLARGLYVLTAHALNGKIYVFGGYGEDGFDAAVQEYDPSSDSWRLRDPIPTSRYIFMSQVVADRAYIIGGQGPSHPIDPEAAPTWDHLSNVDIFDPVLGWSSGAPSPEPLAGGASCAIDSRIFVFGGEANNLNSIYDVETESWTRATPSPVARNGHSCIRVGEAFYLIGGRDSQGSLDLVEKYDPPTDHWQTLDAMPTPRHWFGVAALGEEIFVFGGEHEPSYTGYPNYSLSNALEVLQAR